MLKKACFRQKKIIQRSDVKNLDNGSDNEEAQKELQEREAVFLSIDPADDKKSDISCAEQNQNDSAKHAAR